jgi:hypothetical protein
MNKEFIIKHDCGRHLHKKRRVALGCMKKKEGNDRRIGGQQKEPAPASPEGF